MPRSEFSRAVREAAWLRSEGQCEGLIQGYGFTMRCMAPVDVGCFAYDHIIPDWIGPGRNDLMNCQVLCIPCHKLKTARDVKDIAKIKRIRKKARFKKVRGKWVRRERYQGRNANAARPTETH